MITLTKNDLNFIIGALNIYAEEYADAIDTADNSGAKRVFAMKMERCQALADTLQKALDKGAKRITIE